MAAILEKIGRIIQDERTGLGWSTVNLATKANVRLERIDALERGEPSVNTMDLDQIATVLGLDPVALADGRRVEGNSSVVFLRHAAAGYQNFDPVDMEVCAWALEQGIALFELRHNELEGRLVQQPLEKIQEGVNNEAAKQGYELARRVRSMLGRETDPIEDIRVLVEEQFGIAVLQAHLATRRLPAIAVRSADRQGAAIILNANDEERTINPLVDRVHIAHELCHILFDPTEHGVQLVMEVEGKEDLLEKRARAFAAEFLVPSSSFEKILEGKNLHTNAGARQAVIRLREEFCVPWELPLRQLQNQSGLSEDLAEQLKSAGAGKYPKSATKVPAPGQPSIGLCTALERALSDAFVTEGQARSLLGLAICEPFPWEAHGSAS